MQHLITLQQIRNQHPCREGWSTLLKSLGNPEDLSVQVSLGDIAALERWLAGDDSVDLRAAYVTHAATAAAALAARAATYAAFAAADAARAAYVTHAATAAAAAYVTHAADAAACAAYAADAAEAEHRQQVEDIIAVSPLYALK